jgi:hypothetical protein
MQFEANLTVTSGGILTVLFFILVGTSGSISSRGPSSAVKAGEECFGVLFGGTVRPVLDVVVRREVGVQAAVRMGMAPMSWHDQALGGLSLWDRALRVRPSYTHIALLGNRSL